MSKIIIFEKIREKALNNSLDNLVLFGERNFIYDGKKKYDLIFHAKQTNPYDKEKPCSLVIPVLRTRTIYNENKDAENREKIVVEAYLKNPNPDFTTFAVSSEFLDFYEIILNNKGAKPLPVSLGKYKHISEQEFMNFLKKSHIFMGQIQKKRRIIDNKY